jgi:hypothetical protein
VCRAVPVDPDPASRAARSTVQAASGLTRSLLLGFDEVDGGSGMQALFQFAVEAMRIVVVELLEHRQKAV